MTNFMEDKEILTKITSCKSVEEFKSLGKEMGYDLTDEEAKAYFEKFTKTGELTDDELLQVAGGKPTHLEAEEYLRRTTKCPKCGARGDKLDFNSPCIFDMKWVYYPFVHCKNCNHTFKTRMIRIKIEKV